MSLPPALRVFARDDRGAATVEYALVFTLLIGLIFFIFEMAMAYHWALAAQKGVENGVRMAVTQRPIHSALIGPDGAVLTYARDGGIAAGTLCYFGDVCAAIPTVSCVGGTRLAPECDAARFTALLQVVGRHAYGLAPENLSVTYSESGLGRATETVIPIVTVSISAREFPLALSFFNVETKLPLVSATLVGEYLGN